MSESIRIKQSRLYGIPRWTKTISDYFSSGLYKLQQTRNVEYKLRRKIFIEIYNKSVSTLTYTHHHQTPVNVNEPVYSFVERN